MWLLTGMKKLGEGLRLVILCGDTDCRLDEEGIILLSEDFKISKGSLWAILILKPFVECAIRCELGIFSRTY
jgi:hypothetical protein